MYVLSNAVVHYSVYLNSKPYVCVYIFIHVYIYYLLYEYVSIYVCTHTHITDIYTRP